MAAETEMLHIAGHPDDSLPIHGREWEWKQGAGHQVHRLVPRQGCPCAVQFMGRGSRQPFTAGLAFRRIALSKGRHIP